MSGLSIEREGAVATLVINRPESHNAVRLEMYRALPDLLGGVEADPELKVLVVRGAGTAAFAAGADITEFQELRGSADGARAYNATVAQAERALASMTKPTIAMVHGYCVGGGAGLALACDLRFADEGATFAIPPAKLGIVYSLESTKRLVDVVGPARAKWILMSGNQIAAVRARELGLFDEVVPPADLASATYGFAEVLCTRAQLAVRAAKEMVDRVAAGQVEDDDATRALRDFSFDSDDYVEGVRAFLEKRAPAFTWPETANVEQR